MWNNKNQMCVWGSIDFPLSVCITYQATLVFLPKQMNAKVKRQGHQEDVSVSVFVWIWLRESDLCVHVCV